jgi:hypothetical protein
VPNNNYEEETVANAQLFLRRLLVAENIVAVLVLALFTFAHPVLLSSTGQ